MDYTGYCVKCKKKNVKMEGPKLVPMKGRGKVKRHAISHSHSIIVNLINCT